MSAIYEERARLSFDYHENYEGEDTPVGDLTKLLRLQASERAARMALAEGIAAELGHR